MGQELLRRLVVYFGAASLAIVAAMVTLVVVHAAHPAFDVYSYGAVMYVLLVLLLWFGTVFVAYLWERYPQSHRPMLLVAAMTVAILVAHLYIIDMPPTSLCQNSSGAQGCVMDETYYVPAAQMLLTGAPCAPGLANCNMEHPFLGKALIAAGIAMFGNGDFGWRFFSVLLGTLSIPLVYGISFIVSKSRRLALFATAFFAVDTLFFVQSSIAVLDVPQIFFALAAFLVYFAKARFWKFDNLMLAGALLGISLLAKETAVFFVLLLASYHLLWGGGPRRERLIGVASVALMSFLIFGVGLQAYDSLFVPSYGSFLNNIYYIFTYGSKLLGGGWTDRVFGNIITPLYWLVYYTPIAYSVTKVTVTSPTSSLTYISLGYWGVPNFIEVWMVWVWVPYVCYQLWKSHRTATTWDVDASTVQTASPAEEEVEVRAEAPIRQDDPEVALAKLALLWLGWILLAYLALFALGRVTYPYYFIQAIPGVAMGAGYFVSRRWFRLPVALMVLGLAAAWFVFFYPDKSFFPVWLRAMLGS